jgi:60 kDa SS-A/Ro ribonucleoprotein
MSKFNATSEGKHVVENHMGGKSFKQSEKEELAFSVVSSFLEDSYYESKNKRVKRIADLVKEIASDDPLFVAKLAIVTRREFHMRSASHVLLGELALTHNGDSLVKNTLKEATERPDDLLEIAAYLTQARKKESFPNQIKKGIAMSLQKFDPYQLAKYKGKNKDFALVDLFNITRPKPSNQKQARAWKQLLEGKLKPADTWETRLSSEEGRENKGEVWKELLQTGKLGYMATLRNLRNIAEQGDQETVDLAVAQITNREAVQKSKQLPFRFLSAYEALVGKAGSRVMFEKDADVYGSLRAAVEQALTYSIDNLPDLGGRTVILTDNSGSMRGDGGGASVVSAHSNRKTADIGNLFATLYWMKAENTYVGCFGDRLILPDLDRSEGLFENFRIMNKAGSIAGAATETGIFTAFEKFVAEKTRIDRVVIFSDCQVGTGCNWYDTTGRKQGADFNKLFQEFRKINPKAQIYCVDLKGYGNTLFSEGVFMLSGWSDKIFDLMEMVEKKEGFVKWVENYPVQLI